MPLMLPRRRVFFLTPAGQCALALACLLTGWATLSGNAGEWRSLRSLAGPRQYHSATLLSGGKVLLAGGIKGNIVEHDVSLFDPLADMVLPAGGALRQARFRHTATLLPDGTVLIAGGEDARHQSLSSTELYDPATKKILKLPSLAMPRRGH